MNENFMKEKPVFPLLVSMALPMVISMLVNSLYNIVDSFFVAQISEDAMTALSLVYPVQNFVNAVAIGFGIGLNAVISYYLGAGDKKAAGCAATQGLALTMLHAVILTIGSLLVIERFLRMFSSSETVIDLGVRYSRIIFLFTIAIMANLYFEKVFQAVGRMKVTMTGMMVGCIVNIILDPLIIFGIGPFPRLGIEGAALATGIGQVTPVVIYWIIYKIRPISVKIRPEYLKEGKNLVGRLYAIGVPAILNLALPSLLISALNGILAVYSQSYVVVLGIYYKLQTFIYLTANGIVQGMRPIIGFNYGARKPDRLMKTMRLAVTYAVSIMIIGMILFWAFTKQLLGIFNASEQMLAIGIPALRIISLSFLLAGFDIIIISVMQALGHGVISLIISMMRQLVVLLPAAWLLARTGSVNNVWWAFLIAEVVSLLLSLAFFARINKTVIAPLYGPEEP